MKCRHHTRHPLAHIPPQQPIQVPSPTPLPRTGSSDHVPRSVDVCGRRAKHFGFLFRDLSITGCLTSAADKIIVCHFHSEAKLTIPVKGREGP
jgi:hypothetical protein